MIKTIEINLSGISYPNEVRARFYESLGLNVLINGKETLQFKWYKEFEEANLPKDTKIHWDAFRDDLRYFQGYPGYEEIEKLEVHLVIYGWSDVEKVLSQEEIKILKSVLEDTSDLTQRYDKLKKISYEIIKE